jgi:hypothetical protein
MEFQFCWQFDVIAFVFNSLFSCLGRRRAVGCPSVISDNFIRKSASMSRYLMFIGPCIIAIVEE